MTKALKAKTARRAAKRAKPKKRNRPEEICPVERLGRNTAELARILDHLKEKSAGLSSAAKADAERMEAIVYDAMRANRTAASYLKPKSKLGAAFLLLSIYRDCETMLETNDAVERGEHFRQAHRSLFAMLEWFFHECNASLGLVASVTYMPQNWNPRLLLAVERDRVRRELQS